MMRKAAHDQISTVLFRLLTRQFVAANPAHVSAAQSAAEAAERRTLLKNYKEKDSEKVEALMGSTLKVHVAEKRTLIEKIKVDLKMRRRTDKIPVLERLAALCGGADIAAKAFALGGEYASTDNAYRKRPTVRK